VRCSNFCRKVIDGLRGDLRVFEEGTWAAWLYDLLKPHVSEVLVCNTRKNGKDGSKSDRSDARKLSELLYMNNRMAEYSQPREGFRSDANYLEVCAVEVNGPAEGRRIACEFVLPKIRPEHYHGIATGYLIFVFTKSAPQPRVAHRAPGSSYRKPSFRP
jgi:hypothetical protein